MAAYNGGLSGVDFVVDCTNSITGTYPNVKHSINYKIYLVLGTAYNWIQWNEAVLNFGGHSHTVNFNHRGPGKWEMASGRLEYTFNNASRTDSRNLKFSTSFGNVSASGNQTETATIALPSVSEPSVWSNNYQNVSYSASLSSNPNNFYNIRAILGNDARIGDSGSWNELSPNTDYMVDFYVVYQGAQSTTLTKAISKSVTTAKPDKPSKGSVSYSDLNPFGATFSWSGFQIKDGASSYFYQYSFDENYWSNLDTETSLKLSNLVPETSYIFRIRIVDNFGTVSDFASVSFTTPADQAKVAYNQDIAEEKIMTADGFELIDTNGNSIQALLVQKKESLRTAKMWFNHKGKLKKIKKIYFNDKGTIKVHKNFGV